MSIKFDEINTCDDVVESGVSEKKFEDFALLYEEEKKKVIEVTKQSQENWDCFLRAKAENDNLKRFYEKNILREQRKQLFNFINELLFFIDSLELAVKESEKLKGEEFVSFRSGLLSAYELFISILKKYDISVIDPVDCLFDPKYHEAVQLVSDRTSDINKVFTVLQKGYVYGDFVLRVARVVVGSDK